MSSLNFQVCILSCLHLPNSGIIGLCPHAQQDFSSVHEDRPRGPVTWVTRVTRLRRLSKAVSRFFPSAAAGSGYPTRPGICSWLSDALAVKASEIAVGRALLPGCQAPAGSRDR